ncbi:TonB-dependent receptor [Reichenbachiella ulvae]|uniref:Carboxypeptidase-like regulatory domain-containing protein n=1 Tax=Reichenbachiella ulvae TaxID=2980104 RepID=A0ABT3CQF2_9BACT|nr:TonB-dependent receptor [Reichenbachiella ulvae]MCV9385945.1 carboxypeptidase-like regulatory domain-containing protein [Reichenbachiella ulvae]
MKTLIISTLLVFSLLNPLQSQTLSQSIQGKIIDHSTEEALFGATIMLIGSDPLLGTISTIDGSFRLENVPVGRQSLEIRMIGYESYQVNEILVSSAKSLELEIALTPAITSLEEVTVTYQAAKEKAINEMSLISSRQFTVDETQRYAGGLNDPARLVSAFAGVASPSISSNGISIRGNSPGGLLWRVEGVETPSPNHFANLTLAGAGALTVLSSQVMGNSDFYTGAFPAEYGNASSGVFDINLRSGNTSNREHTIQAGVLGVEFATEGPMNKAKGSSYLINYRYSSLGLIAPFLPSDAGILKYQDLLYKLKMPTQKAGQFSLWGMAAYDAIDMEAQDSTEWISKADRENSQTHMHLFASGLNHKINLGSKTKLESALAISGNGLSFEEQYVDDQLISNPQSYAQKNEYKITLQSIVTSYISERHMHRSGFYINHLRHDLQVDDAPSVDLGPETIIKDQGHAMHYQLFSQSQFQLSNGFKINAGLHLQYFELNENFSLEPRLSIQYDLSVKSSLSLAYGLHSKIEPLSLYFIKNDEGSMPNQDLDLMKSHHLVFSFSTQISEHLHLTIEPYYQYLTQVPVAPDSYISTLNISNNLFFNETLVNDGNGRNMGIDLSLERYLHNGFYYLISASLFDSKYTAADGIERNTRFNKNYVGNIVLGKEWQMGKNSNNTLGTSIRINYLGGNRKESIDEESSLIAQDVIYGERDGELSFSQKQKDLPIVSFTLSYRKNKARYSSVWSLQVINATQTEEFSADIFNQATQRVESQYTATLIPNLSYKIEF